jgi:hypothetical protein
MKSRRSGVNVTINLPGHVSIDRLIGRLELHNNCEKQKDISLKSRSRSERVNLDR